MNMAHDIQRLKQKIDRLHQRISTLAQHETALGGIIHKPGWTTVAEFAFVEASIDSLHRQIDTVSQHYQELVSAASQVGNG
jgi:prefoldin subunit 5